MCHKKLGVCKVNFKIKNKVEKKLFSNHTILGSLYMKNFRNVVRKIFILGMAIFSLFLMAPRAIASSANLTMVNQSRLPVYGTTLRIPADIAANAVGVSLDTPLELQGNDGANLPLFRLKSNGHTQLCSITSLKGSERVEYILRPADRWGGPAALSSGFFNAVTKSAKISNGLVTLTYSSNVWSLAYTSDNKAIICQDNRMDYWLSDKRHGRLMGISDEKLREMDLLRSTESTLIEKGESLVNSDGSATLILQKRFLGKGENVRWEESYTLLAGEPILIYKQRWTCTDDVPRYIAYVGLGGGLVGEYGSLLRGNFRFKYDIPTSGSDQTASGISVANTSKNSTEGPRILLSGKNNGFTRISWRNERCWVGVDSELGSGLVITTLKDAYTRFIPGNTVWAFSNSGYNARLLDHQQENQPYEFSREKPLELGYAVAVTCAQVGIWNQGRELFKAVTTNETPSIGDSCSVYLNGLPIKSGQAPSFKVETKNMNGLISSGNLLRAALETDFKRPYTLTVEAAGVSAMNPLDINIISGENTKLSLLKCCDSGKKRVDFTAETGWLKSRRTYMLEINPSGNSTLRSLQLEPAPFEPPQLDLPADNLAMTDVATFFRWHQVGGAIDYEIQLSRSGDFESPVVFNVRSEVVKPYYMPSDAELPANGKWYWRVRAVEEDGLGQWSVIRVFTINNDTAKRPCVFNPSPEHPVFTMEGCRVPDWSRFKNTLPADIKPYVVINTGVYNTDDYIGYYKPLADFQISTLLRTHGPSAMSYWVPLSMVEKLFQVYPNIIGISAGETLSAHYHGGDNQTYTERLLKICAKYGRVFYDADGSYPNEFKYQALYEKKGAFMEEFKDYLILAQKNNILHRQMVSQSAVLGLYLTGGIQAQGAWEDGGWYWQQTGFKKLGEAMGQRGGDVTMMPRIFWTLNYAMGLGRGCTVFSFEGQVGTTPVPKGWNVEENGLPEITDACYRNPAAFWTTDGELLPIFKRFCLPFMRAVINHKLVPSKEDVLKNVKLAVYNDGIPKKNDGDQYYYEWEDVYRGTYGFRDIGVHPGTLMEFFPNTGRYFYFPVLPQGKRDLGDGVEVVPLSKLTDVPKVRSVFNAAYPEWYTGDALVNIVGNTLTVLNSNENLDEVQTWSVPLGGRAGLDKISGIIAPHAYVLGKFRKDSIWLQMNVEYYERGDITEISLFSHQQPKVTVTPAEAVQMNEWSADSGELRLKLSHAASAVEVEIK